MQGRDLESIKEQAVLSFDPAASANPLPVVCGKIVDKPNRGGPVEAFVQVTTGLYSRKHRSVVASGIQEQAYATEIGFASLLVDVILAELLNVEIQIKVPDLVRLEILPAS